MTELCIIIFLTFHVDKLGPEETEAKEILNVLHML